MLKTAPLLRQPSVQAMLEIWTNRYKFFLPDDMTFIDPGMLVEAASPQGRRRTAIALKQRLKVACELAALKANSLFSVFESFASHINLADTRRLAGALTQAYEGLLDVYEQQQISPLALEYLGMTYSPHQEWARANMIQISTIEQLIVVLEPSLLELQSHHLDCHDSRTIGFFSTQFHFGTSILMERLNRAERLLLLPYLRFVEEQVCIPWQRVCAAAARHAGESAVFTAALTLMAQSQEISEICYQKSVIAYPDHHSRRGSLRTPGIAASFTRDFAMFQAYFWLSVLEGNITAIEEELLPLCVIVFPSVSVDWDLVEFSVDILTDEILERLSPEHQALVKPYAEQMKFLFVEARNLAVVV